MDSNNRLIWRQNLRLFLRHISKVILMTKQIFTADGLGYDLNE
jgi:hypothetical protein